MSGSTIKITEKDYKNIKGVLSGMVYTRDGGSFNLSSVDSIIQESDYLLEKANKNVGVLHDGQRVIKKFGVWYVDDGSFQIMINPQYYPEVAKDCVPTPQEFEQKYLALPKEERLKLMLPEKREGGGLKKLNPKQ